MSVDAAWVARAAADFGRSLGLADWAPDAAGEAALRLQSGVVLHLLSPPAGGDQIVLRIDCPIAFEAPALLQRALEAAHVRQGRLLQLGLRGSGSQRVLQVAERLPWREASGPALAAGFERLLDWFEALR